MIFKEMLRTAHRSDHAVIINEWLSTSGSIYCTIHRIYSSSEPSTESFETLCKRYGIVGA